jgi:hypothetical protein
MFHDMCKEFWHAMGWVFLISAIVVRITGWYLDFRGFLCFCSPPRMLYGSPVHGSTWQRIRV